MIRERDPDLVRSAEVEDGIGAPEHVARLYERLDRGGEVARLRARAVRLVGRLAEEAPAAELPEVPPARSASGTEDERRELERLCADLEARIGRAMGRR